MLIDLDLFAKFRWLIIFKQFSEKVPCQMSTPLRQFSDIHHGDSHPYELTFLAENIPALGIKQYLITVDEQAEPVLLKPVEPEDFLQLGSKVSLNNCIYSNNCNNLITFRTWD